MGQRVISLNSVRSADEDMGRLVVGEDTSGART